MKDGELSACPNCLTLRMAGSGQRGRIPEDSSTHAMLRKDTWSAGKTLTWSAAGILPGLWNRTCMSYTTLSNLPYSAKKQPEF
jgi:hypothetical protein